MTKYATPTKRNQVNTMMTADDVDRIAGRINDQAWDGVEAVDGLPGRGRGVKTTRAFQQHEVVCDYNGQLLNHKEGYYIT